MKGKSKWLVASLVVGGFVSLDAARAQTSAISAINEGRLARVRFVEASHHRALPQRAEKRIERIVRKEFHSRPKLWLAGIELTGDQRRQIEHIQNRTLEQLRAIGRDVDAREENGKPIGIFRDRVVDLMQKEKNEIRDVLNPQQRDRFDMNVARLKNPW